MNTEEDTSFGFYNYLKGDIAFNYPSGDRFARIMKEHYTISNKKDETKHQFIADVTLKGNVNGSLKNVTVFKHINYELQVKGKSPTCTEPGTTLYKVCSVCGEMIGENKPLPALGHDYKAVQEWNNDKAHKRICSRCRKEYYEDHDYEEKVLEEPTYTTRGVTLYTCKSCGHIMRKDTPVKPHEHDYKEEITTQPTCTSDGVKAYICKLCGHVETKTLPALGHDYQVKSALNDHLHLLVCIRDGTHLKAEEHHFDEGKADQNGVKVFTCKDCGYEKREDKNTPAHKHDYKESIIKLATCEKPGEKLYKCATCGDSYTKEIPALGHQYGAWTSVNTQYHQRVCEHDQMHIEKDNHHFDDGRVTKEATYANEGTKSYTCQDCGFVKTTSIPALNHTHDYQVTITKQPTCSEKGIRTYTCKLCGHHDQEEVDALGHDYGHWTALDAKEHQRICAHDQTHVEKKEHHFNEGNIIADPTYSKEGLKLYTCRDCGFVKEEKMAKIDHEHDYKEKVTKEAACEAPGEMTYTCSICGDSYTKEVPALDHNYGQWMPLNRQHHQRVCTHNGSHVEKEDHQWDEGKVTLAATEDGEGIKTYTCKVCGEEKDERIAKLPSTNTSNLAQTVNSTPQITSSHADEESKKANKPQKQTASASKATAKKTIKQDTKIANVKGKQNVAGAQYRLLQAKVSQASGTKVKLTWHKVKGAFYYGIYYKTKGKNYTLVSKVKGTSWTHKNVKKGTAQYIIAAYDQNNKAVTYSPTLILSKKGTITLQSSKKVTLKVKQSMAIKVKGKAHFESGNKKIALVSSKGKIMAKKKGQVFIYAYGDDGTNVKVKVIVK